MIDSQRTQNIRRLRREDLNKLTGKIIGLAIKVHKLLGPGFVERVYERALSYEFKKEKLNFRNQAIIKVQYEDLEIGDQRVDFMIEEEVIVEIKSVSKIIELFEHQMLSYLKTSDRRIGLILNFGRRSLEIKRMVYNL
ncbi:MAG TPA: GxxExxY protein [Elusimicrobia bacterium]|jgi:GxxExxY protein|nr:GxxExxY protein [Elusimicrobiota bacterium]